jgi:AraC family transcriptional regulator
MSAYPFSEKMVPEKINFRHHSSSMFSEMENIKFSTKGVQSELYVRLQKAKSAVDEDISRKIDITSLAREANLSAFHFSRSFKNAFGISPYQYVLNRRLDRSVELLKAGNCMLTEIAYQVGFNDIYSFSKSFKKRFNTCPSRLILN